MIWETISSSLSTAVTNRKSLSVKGDHSDAKRGEQQMVMNGQIVMENVRRYRAIASLYRQTAALRPLQKWSLLDQAEGRDGLAAEEAFLIVCNSPAGEERLQASPRTGARWELMAAADCWRWVVADQGFVSSSGTALAQQQCALTTSGYQ